MKMGRLDESHIDLENVVRKEPENEEANRLYSMIDTLKENLANAISYLNWNNYDQAHLRQGDHGPDSPQPFISYKNLVCLKFLKS